MRRADAILVQTDDQRARLRQHFHRDGLLMPSLCHRFPAQVEAGGGHTVLWAGRARGMKRPLMFLDLARSCPGVQFVMALSDRKTDPVLADRVINEAKHISNLKLLIDVPYREMSGHFDDAAVLVNTSEYEGFPNTFLEAWAVGRPVVATVNPDGLLTRNRLGLHVHDLEGSTHAVTELMASPERRREIGLRARELVGGRHSREAVLNAYIEVITQAAQGYGLRIGGGDG